MTGFSYDFFLSYNLNAKDKIGHAPASETAEANRGAVWFDKSDVGSGNITMR